MSTTSVPAGEAFYSTRQCRCGAAMTRRANPAGRVEWVCPICGRRQRG